MDMVDPVGSDAMCLGGNVAGDMAVLLEGSLSPSIEGCLSHAFECSRA